MPYIGKKPADIIATVIDTTTGTFSGEVDAGSLDVSGNADIDGITNLDNTDIDGTLDVTGDLTVVGSSTFDDIKLTGVSLPAAGNPSIALRDTNNVVYHQSGSGNSIVLLDSLQNTMYNASSSSHIFNTGNSQRLLISSGGDISFYEDTGTTPKLFWNASTERLGVGTSSPEQKVHIEGISL